MTIFFVKLPKIFPNFVNNSDSVDFSLNVFCSKTYILSNSLSHSHEQREINIWP